MEQKELWSILATKKLLMALSTTPHLVIRWVENFISLSNKWPDTFNAQLQIIIQSIAHDISNHLFLSERNHLSWQFERVNKPIRRCMTCVNVWAFIFPTFSCMNGHPWRPHVRSGQGHRGMWNIGHCQPHERWCSGQGLCLFVCALGSPSSPRRWRRK
jgi:hypothetical protein